MGRSAVLGYDGRMNVDLNHDLLDLLRGSTTEAALAAKHGVTTDEVSRWRVAYVGGLEAASRRRPRQGRALLTAIAALGVVLLAREARSGTCSSPSAFLTALGLSWFCPDEPALAAEVNGNFEKLGAIVQQKLGTLGPVASSNANISTGVVTASGATVNGATTLNSTTTVNGPFTVNGAVALGTNSTTTVTLRGTVQAFGTETSVTPGTVYNAPSDGFVLVRLTATGSCNGSPAQAYGYADTTSSPVTLRSQTSVHNGCSNQDYATAQGAFTMPVRKGENYAVQQAGGTLTASFMPLGR